MHLENRLALKIYFYAFKVPGNFHVSTHSVDTQPDDYDFSHQIHEIR